MIDPINEITVWLDQLEDDGQDVSCLRLLCSYNYLPCSLSIAFDHKDYRSYIGFGDELGQDETIGNGYGVGGDNFLPALGFLGGGYGSGYGIGRGQGSGDSNYDY